MPQFAANLSMLYTELPFLDRFEAAAADGFKAVEFLFPYAWPAAEIAARHVRERPPSLRALNPNVTPSAEYVINKAMAREFGINANQVP